jgi:hypothetical protein
VAVHKENDNVILLGDKSFLRSDRFNVGDNEEFAAYLVEFLITGERVPDSDDDEETETEADDEETDDEETDDEETVELNNTTTPDPTTPAASLRPPVTAAESTVPVEGASPAPVLARVGERVDRVGAVG